MNSKEQIFKMIEGRTETMQTLAVECIELIFNAGYNEAIEAALNEAMSDSEIFEAIRRLKK